MVTQGAVTADLLPLLGPNGQGEGTTFRTGKKNILIWLSDGSPTAEVLQSQREHTNRITGLDHRPDWARRWCGL